MAPEQVTEIAERLDVPEMEVINMNRRLGPGDHSLNATIGGESEGGEWLDWLEDDSENQEVTFAEAEEYDSRRQLLVAAMGELNAREVEIIKARRLSDTPLTLEELSQRFNVSRERIRQIEARAFEKLQLSVRNRAIENKLIES